MDFGRIEDGLERMNRSYELMASEEPDEDLAMLAAQVGRFMFFGGQPELAAQRIAVRIFPVDQAEQVGRDAHAHGRAAKALLGIGDEGFAD